MAKLEADTSDISTSRNVYEIVSGAHRMEIKGYSLAKGMGVWEYISSDVFTAGGYKWAICFYPDGNDENNEYDTKYVSVYIALKSKEKGINVRAKFKLTLVAQTGSMQNKVYDTPKNHAPHTFISKSRMWGYKKFYERESLETSEFLHEDCLVFECTVEVVTGRIETLQKYSIAMPPPDMATSFRHIFDNQIGCDINFKVGDKIFKAHKLILAARSPVFKAQFYGLVGNSSMDIVEIEEIDPHIFKAMLLYIYTDSLPHVREIMGSKSSSSYEIMVQHLLAAADRFCIDRLKLICESKLCDAITVKNVPTILSLADLHGCAQLKSACLKFVAANLNGVETGSSYSNGSNFTWMSSGWWKSRWRKN